MSTGTEDCVTLTDGTHLPSCATNKAEAEAKADEATAAALCVDPPSLLKSHWPPHSFLSLPHGHHFWKAPPSTKMLIVFFYSLNDSKCAVITEQV